MFWSVIFCIWYCCKASVRSQDPKAWKGSTTRRKYIIPSTLALIWLTSNHLESLNIVLKNHLHYKMIVSYTPSQKGIIVVKIILFKGKNDQEVHFWGGFFIVWGKYLMLPRFGNFKVVHTWEYWAQCKSGSQKVHGKVNSSSDCYHSQIWALHLKAQML